MKPRETIWIVGNGPSLAGVDISFLRTEQTMVTNSFFLHPQFPEIRPKTYVLADPAFFGTSVPGHDATNQLKRIVEATEKAGGSTFTVPLPYAQGFRLPPGSCSTTAYWTYGNHIEEPRDLDLKNSPRWGQNVLNAALMVALSQNPNHIFLIGFDHGGIVQEFGPELTAHFYSGHSDDSSLPKNMNQILQNALPRHLQQIHAICRYATRKGVQVWTCNPACKLKTFPVLELDVARRLFANGGRQ
jgi:hypothetical protein